MREERPSAHSRTPSNSARKKVPVQNSLKNLYALNGNVREKKSKCDQIKLDKIAFLRSLTVFELRSKRGRWMEVVYSSMETETDAAILMRKVMQAQKCRSNRKREE